MFIQKGSKLLHKTLENNNNLKSAENIAALEYKQVEPLFKQLFCDVHMWMDY